jgi:simple sugar transport system permease protein
VTGVRGDAAGGAFAGLAGDYLVGDVGSFSEGMTSGRGFIALAAAIFGKWRPFQAMLGAMLFGFFDALQNQLQISGVNAPVPILLMVPYLATIVVLAGFIGRAIPPAADGIPYVKE